MGGYDDDDDSEVEKDAVRWICVWLIVLLESKTNKQPEQGQIISKHYGVM